jgi:hypothetical protein
VQKLVFSLPLSFANLEGHMDAFQTCDYAMLALAFPIFLPVPLYLKPKVGKPGRSQGKMDIRQADHRHDKCWQA